MRKKRNYLLLLILTPFLTLASPPPAADVFQLTAHVLDPNTLIVDWLIKPGYFLYQNRIKLIEAPDSLAQIGSIRFPTPLKHTDKQGQIYSVYRLALALPVAVLGRQSGEALIDIHFQGCADDGYCYPPQTQPIKITIDNQLALTQVTLETEETTPLNQGNQTKPNDIDQLMLKNNWGIILLSFFGFGLLLSLTPCVLPMIPVLSGLIVGHGKDLSTRKAFLLSLSYVLSMSITYAAFGAIVAVMGHNLQMIMQAPWAIGLFSALFVLLALSMFNVYQLRLPVSWQAKLAQITRSQSSGHYLSAAVMGCLSTLILSPCVTAPLIGVLSYIARSGQVVLGSLTLFFLSLGMGAPLLLIGASAGRWLPKAGHWMNAVQSFFGVLMLVVAIQLLSRLLPPALTMALWGSLLLCSGVFLGAFTRANTHLEKARQGLGLIFLVYGVLILIGASKGSSNPWQPLAAPTECLASQPFITTVKTVKEVTEALAQARGKPVILDFYADWCATCKIIETTTLRDPRIQALLSDIVILKVDLTQNNADTRALLAHFQVVAPPTFLFFNAASDELKSLRLVGDISSDQLIERLSVFAKER